MRKWKTKLGNFMTKDTTKDKGYMTTPPEKKNGVVIKQNSQHNEFELSLRFLGNELIAIKLAATNFSAKLIVWSILLLIFSFMILEVFGLSAMLGYG